MDKKDMRKNMLFALAAVVLLLAVFAAYKFWTDNHPAPAPVQLAKTTPTLLPAAPVSAPVATPPKSPAVETIPAQPPLPHLANSDSFVVDALSGLLENKSLMKLFYSERVIRKIVVSIVDLTQQHVPVKVMPFKAPSRHFLADNADGNLTMSSENTARYTPYVKLAEAVDAKKLIELYVRLYPLFQQAYEEVGYPKKNFNDRLTETLDDLLDTPDVKGPIKLVQPTYYYLFADSELEDISIGQKIMLRLGNKNLDIIRAKLTEIKKELELRLGDLKTGKPV